MSLVSGDSRSRTYAARAEPPLVSSTSFFGRGVYFAFTQPGGLSYDRMTNGYGYRYRYATKLSEWLKPVCLSTAAFGLSWTALAWWGSNSTNTSSLDFVCWPVVWPELKDAVRRWGAYWCIEAARTVAHHWWSKTHRLHSHSIQVHSYIPVHTQGQAAHTTEHGARAGDLDSFETHTYSPRYLTRTLWQTQSETQTHTHKQAHTLWHTIYVQASESFALWYQ